MTLAESLHTAIYSLPRSEAQTAMIFATRPDWSGEIEQYIAAMPRDELELVFATLAKAVARCTE